MKKRILSLLLTLALLAGVTAAAATAGSAENPLVSLSWARNWASQAVKTASDKASAELNAFGATAIAASRQKTVAGPKAYRLAAGDTMTLGTGSTLVLSSGSATVSIQRGTLVNATAGSAVSSGSLKAQEQYIVCENSSVTVTAASASTILACGTVTAAITQTFTDVKAADWFYDAVTRGVSLGLIQGMTENTYEPNKTLSRAEAITLAARMHSLDTTGSTTISGSGTKWYDVYRTYCIKEGIIDAGYGSYTDAQMNAAISRGEFVHIFYHALPEDSYTAVNAIADGAVPDVPMSDTWADEIYAMYRAGILTGYTGTPPYAEHAFGADSNIRRSEVAVIVVRMMEADARVSFTI